MINRGNLLRLSVVVWMAFVWVLLWGTSASPTFWAV